MSENLIKKGKPYRRNGLLTFLVISCMLTLCTASYILGRITSTGGERGRIIDTIIISLQSQEAGKSASPKPSQKISYVTIKARITYKDGTPFSNGLVELSSEPRYTITNANGEFTFEKVDMNKHTIYAYMDGKVVASCVVNLTQADSGKTNGAVFSKLSNGEYLVNITGSFGQLDIDMQISDNLLVVNEVRPVEKANPSPLTTEIPPPSVSPETPASSPSASSGGNVTPSPSSPLISDNPTPSPSNTDVQTSTPQPSLPVTSDTPAPTKIDSPLVEWTQLSQVDIFAKRTGSSGVWKDIDNKNVIRPGANGSYPFKLENKNSFDIKYSLSIEEADTNSPKLPMKFRLLKGSSGSDYVGGDSSWKSAVEISQKDIALEAGETEVLTLEWNWQSISDEEDTAIGIQGAGKSYTLNITINAESDE